MRKKKVAAIRIFANCALNIVSGSFLFNISVCFLYNPAIKKIKTQTINRNENGTMWLYKISLFGTSKYLTNKVTHKDMKNMIISPKKSINGSCLPIDVIAIVSP